MCRWVDCSGVILSRSQLIIKKRRSDAPPASDSIVAVSTPSRPIISNVERKTATWAPVSPCWHEGWLAVAALLLLLSCTVQWTQRANSCEHDPEHDGTAVPLSSRPDATPGSSAAAAPAAREPVPHGCRRLGMVLRLRSRRRTAAAVHVGLRLRHRAARQRTGRRHAETGAATCLRMVAAHHPAPGSLNTVSPSMTAAWASNLSQTTPACSASSKMAARSVSAGMS